MTAPLIARIVGAVTLFAAAALWLLLRRHSGAHRAAKAKAARDRLERHLRLTRRARRPT